MSLLEVTNLTAFYDASQAIFDVNIHVEKGEVVALMGRNGMGKSTTVKSICRMLPHASGEITFAGHSLKQLPSFKAVRLGIGLVPEGRRCFTNLNIYENLMAAARVGEWDFDKVCKLFPCLLERKHQNCGSLSGGEQQMVAIARALMTNPKLLILDEATEGLAPIVRQEIWQAINVIKQESDLAILIIDKSLKELSTVADRAVILERGKNVWQGKFSELDSTISNQYLGV